MKPLPSANRFKDHMSHVQPPATRCVPHSTRVPCELLSCIFIFVRVGVRKPLYPRQMGPIASFPARLLRLRQHLSI